MGWTLTTNNYDTLDGQKLHPYTPMAKARGFTVQSINAEVTACFYRLYVL